MFRNLGCWNCDQGVYDFYLYMIVLFLLLIKWVFDFVKKKTMIPLFYIILNLIYDVLVICFIWFYLFDIFHCF
jgi:hypothetical protein